jgi:hypothetical protein
MREMTHEEAMLSAIQTAYACAQACHASASACLQDTNVAGLRDCIRLDLDCAAICTLSAEYMSRDSDFHVQACQVCADICDACALESQLHRDLPHCRECAEACRRCAETCRSMIEALA